MLHKTIKHIVDKYLVFSYLLKKPEFLKLAEEVLGMDPQDEGKKLYKQFKVKNP